MEFALIFERVLGQRLAAAEQLVVGLPTLLKDDLTSCDLAYTPQGARLLVKLHLRDKAFVPEIASRLDFWTHSFGGAVSGDLSKDAGAKRHFEHLLSGVIAHENGVAPAKLTEALNNIVKAAGLSDARRKSPRAVIAFPILLDGEHHTVRDISESGLFVLSAHFPPVGDVLRITLTLPGIAEPWEIDAVVAHCRTAAQGPEAPTGFGLAFKEPPEELTEALSAYVRAHRSEATSRLGRRTHPRYAVRAPVKVLAKTAAVNTRGHKPATEIEPPSVVETETVAAQTVTLMYDDADAFSRDYVENLSLGGALIRTETPLPEQSEVTLRIVLPDGTALEASGVVVHSTGGAMGIQFQMTEPTKVILANFLESVAAPATRVLIAAPEEPWGRSLERLLCARGISCSVAKTGKAALHQLIEELMGLSTLVIGHGLSGMTAEQWVKLIRGSGGERQLGVVIIAPTEQHARLLALGANVTLAPETTGDAVVRAVSALAVSHGSTHLN
ncbi:MAG: PilZ domain-containing protein [Myxococcaceae bacterium]